MAIGYLSGRISAKLLATRVNIPILLMLSVIPDGDLLFSRFMEHRGPTHSVIVALIVFAPFFAVYRKKAIPYCLALVQHSLVGDYIAGGQMRLLWPLTNQYYGMEMSLTSPTNVSLEWLTFLIAIFVMLLTKDAATFFKPFLSNLILVIPAGTALASTVILLSPVTSVWLVPPHICCFFMFTAAVLVTLWGVISRSFKPETAYKQDAP